MDFALTDEQREHKDHVRKFAREVIRPVARKHDEEESTPWEVIKEARKWGLQGLEHMQLMGADPGGQLGVITAEELHWGCAGIALAIQGSGLAAAGIAASGHSRADRRVGPAVLRHRRGDPARRLRGHRAAGRLRREEPEEHRQARRRRVGPQRHQGLHHQRRHRRRPRRRRHGRPGARPPRPGLLRGRPRARPGLRQGKKESKIGIRASHTAEVILEDCRIPVENLLGGMDKLNRKLERARSGQKGGSSNALATFEMTRPIVGASALGIAQAAYEWTLEYLGDQTVDGGRPALEEQRIQQVLADVATEIDAARLLVQRASWMGRNGIPMTGGQGSMSKLKAGDVTMWATTTLMELVGPYAQTTDCPLEKWFRDAKIYQLFEGTAQVQRLVISRMQARTYQERFAAGRRGRAGGATNGAAQNGAKPSRSPPARPRSAAATRVFRARRFAGVQPSLTMTGSKRLMLALCGAAAVCALRVDGRQRLGPGPPAEAQLHPEQALPRAGARRRAHRQDQPRVRPARAADESGRRAAEPGGRRSPRSSPRSRPSSSRRRRGSTT